eukprot:CAMPEP_0197530298 /NCGR_PEP_ID=MMETSP1318-20131121/31384_1 /TAXON_ID=552666 /ORGANISM="Partenskyella glossopodia, Strain RCC365" /LENGTH=539 /DNA_ID=CAMNT_0043086059 /DNA_START=53 /DNA_END=1669 /DNA_ORIENTATION=+
MAQLNEHASETDCWIAVDGMVLDVTSFLDAHPGGRKILLKEGGKDATKKFKMFHGPNVLKKYKKKLAIGVIEGSAAHKAIGKDSKTKAESRTSKLKDHLFVQPPPAKLQYKPFGELVPWGDPSWYQGNNSPFYTESHIKFRKRCREFMEREIAPNVHEWDESYSFPKEIFKKFYDAGLLPAIVGPPWESKLSGLAPPEGGFDSFHELIIIDELARCGSGGVCWALFAGISIGLPPILHFGSEEMKQRVGAACLRAEKFICLAITEPWAGSDVANIRTTARREGDFYIINGVKKWITNGIWSDYFTVAVRTGGPGARGISMVLVERERPGVSCRHMKCMGMWPSGTTYITFEDVKVPVSNLIGVENQGFKQIMFNFNHERWSLVCQSNRLARVLFEESFQYAMKRRTFGKSLMDHQVIRFKLAEMARLIDSTHAWTELVTYQLLTMTRKEQNQKLGGTIALLKAQSSKVMEYCAREAAQIFGGASFVRGGVGEKIERLYREVRGYAIPGGSEEILEDFAIRQAQKSVLKKQKKQQGKSSK